MCRHEPIDDEFTGQTICKKCGRILLLCKRVNGKPTLQSMGGGFGESDENANKHETDEKN